jgi:hypothetical protein
METIRATGPFEVKLAPEPLHEAGRHEKLARMSIDKRFRGDLDATSRGEMLAARTEEPTSAGYVAMERVSGKLNGRAGTFVLQHSSTMTRGTPTQSVTVVPDSGTGGLVGLTGAMSIVIEGGKHSYVFDYTLPGESAV